MAGADPAQPVGLGTYRFVRITPGVELVLDANEQYWRKKPTIKTVVIKGVPDRTTRLAMLRTGEADLGYLMIGIEAATVKADQAPVGQGHSRSPSAMRRRASRHS